ncbi:accessory gene regulator ArgB-like protein [Lutispora thermophila]|uniref:Accessory gene regulator B n=1 Tax=Lutispora thermophila DSM 19022 TaxID=1122184 RepID=A0A1M6IMW2_9FIRM|nr:accessory gene regulator B family protein [Lutispora thermophila]SHJ35775.1 accessory gene regulator B [Lutispora thermophila DSM 19022]
MFIDSISKTISQKMLDASIISIEDKDIYYYGLQLIVSTIVKGMGLLIIALLFDKVVEALIFIGAFGLLRINAGGFHLDTYFKCFVVTSAFMMLCIWIGNMIPLSIAPYIIICCLAMTALFILLYAPVDNPNRPLNGKEYKKFRVRSLYIMYFFAITIILVCFIKTELYKYMCIASLSILFEGITLLPVWKR